MISFKKCRASIQEHPSAAKWSEKETCVSGFGHSGRKRKGRCKGGKIYIFPLGQVDGDYFPDAFFEGFAAGFDDFAVGFVRIGAAVS